MLVREKGARKQPRLCIHIHFHFAWHCTARHNRHQQQHTHFLPRYCRQTGVQTLLTSPSLHPTSSFLAHHRNTRRRRRRHHTCISSQHLSTMHLHHRNQGADTWENIHPRSYSLWTDREQQNPMPNATSTSKRQFHCSSSSSSSSTEIKVSHAYSPFPSSPSVCLSLTISVDNKGRRGQGAPSPTPSPASATDLKNIQSQQPLERRKRKP
jgi:hypothetical protein